MYSSAVLAVVLASAASSSLAAPLAPVRFGGKVPTTFGRIHPARQSTDASGALNTGLIKDVVDIGNGVINGIDGIKQIFSREELELLARQTQASTDASGALNTGIIKDAVDIGNGIINGIDGIKSLFSREELELLARQTQASTDASGALNTGLIKDVVDIGNGVINGIDGIKNLFNREELELLARQTQTPSTDASGALNTGLIKDVVDIGNGVINGIDGIKNLFTGNNKRDFESLVARQVQSNDASGALNTGIIKDAVDIGNGIITGIDGIKNFFTGGNKREFEELLARQAQDDASAALNIGSIVKVGGEIINGLGSLFGGDNNNKREVQELLARHYVDVLARQAPTTDDSGALNIGSIVKVGSDIISGLGSLFGGDNNNKREVAELVLRELAARQTPTTDDSGALNIGSIVKVGGEIINGLGSLFGGDNNQKREFTELLVRELVARQTPTTDDSGALNIGSIVKVGSDIISGLGSLFGGDNNNKREVAELVLRELVARQTPTTDDSGALNIGSIVKVGGEIINGLGSLFGGDDNNSKREFEEVFARALAARSLNELD